MLGALLGSPYAVVETFSDDPELELLGAEHDAIAGAVPRRLAEFATSRRCARDALERIGLPRRPLLAGPGREPIWPPGVVGSITHCDGYRAAAVAATTAGSRGVGIDAEPNEPLPHGVLEVVAGPVERAHVHALHARSPEIAWDRLLFSAKESVYKLWYPAARTWLGFEDADVELGTASFTATLHDHARAGRADLPVVVAGRWLLDEHRQLLVTCAVRESGR